MTVQEYYPALKAHLAAQSEDLPAYVEREFEEYLRCGRLEHGFVRVRGDSRHAAPLVAFRGKRRGFCPSCGARRMTASTALLVDEVFPDQPVRQWVLSVPFPSRYTCSRAALRPRPQGRGFHLWRYARFLGLPTPARQLRRVRRRLCLRAGIERPLP